jgi:hypothetical protein
VPGSGGSGAGRRLFTALAILLVLGGGLLYLARPDLFDFGIDIGLDFGGKRATRLKNEAARADSLRAESVRAQASNAVDVGLARSIEWLNQLETLPVEDNALSGANAAIPSFSVSSFTPPDRFALKGFSLNEATLSAIQEALVLLPGADVSESRAEKSLEKSGGYAYTFSGTVALLPEDSLPPVDRTIPVARLAAELDLFRNTAQATGITLADPVPGASSLGGGLEARAYRVSGTCDSTGVSGIRAFLDAERRRGSPFGVRRLMLENRNGHRSLFLDIMTYTR